MTVKIEDVLKGRRDIGTIIDDRASTIELTANMLLLNKAVGGDDSIQQYRELSKYTRETMNIIIAAQKAENGLVDQLTELLSKIEKKVGAGELSKASECLDAAATKLEEADCIILSEWTKVVKKGLEMITANDSILELGRNAYMQLLKSGMLETEKQIEKKEGERQKCLTIMIKLDSLTRG